VRECVHCIRLYITGWRRCMGCLTLRVSFRKRATNYRAFCGQQLMKIRLCITHTLMFESCDGDVYIYHTLMFESCDGDVYIYHVYAYVCRWCVYVLHIHACLYKISHIHMCMRAVTVMCRHISEIRICKRAVTLVCICITYTRMYAGMHHIYTDV